MVVVVAELHFQRKTFHGQLFNYKFNYKCVFIIFNNITAQTNKLQPNNNNFRILNPINRFPRKLTYRTTLLYIIIYNYVVWS